MKGMRILRALNWVDDEYLEELQEGAGKSHRGKRRLTAFIVIAALVSLLGIGVIASEDKLNTGEWFYYFFAGDNRLEVMGEIAENQQQMLKRDMVEINETMTKDGWTVTLESCITDGYRLLLKYRLDAPEGIVLDPYTYNLDVYPIIKTADGKRVDWAGYDCWHWLMPDEDPDDNSMTAVADMILEYTHDGKLFTTEENVEWTLEICNIHDRTGASETGMVSKYTWDFFVPLGEQHVATDKIVFDKKTYYTVTAKEGDREFEVKLKVKSFEMRALTACVTFEPVDAAILEYEDISIVLKDGTVVRSLTSAFGHYEDGTLGLLMSFDQPVLMSDVDYIDFP